MSNSKKYDLEISQTSDGWLSKVTRKVSSKKRVTTKQQSGFKSEAEAKEWGESVLVELTGTQRQSNDAHLKKRKENEEIQRQRSARRASKTEKAKIDAAAAKESEAELVAAEEELID